MEQYENDIDGMIDPDEDRDGSQAGVGSETQPTTEEVGRPAKLAIRLVKLDLISVGPRFRGLDEFRARQLAETIREDGRLLQPIGVTSDLHLVYGRHRLRACEILGWTEVPAVVSAYSHESPQAEMDELDENLARTELTSLQVAQGLARRKAAYERLHPATKRGAKGGRPAKESHVCNRYQRPDGAIVEVFQGLAGGDKWLVGCQSLNGGGHHRIKSPKLRPQSKRERAQYQLDRYAAEKKWTPIGVAGGGPTPAGSGTETTSRAAHSASAGHQVPDSESQATSARKLSARGADSFAQSSHHVPRDDESSRGARGPQSFAEDTAKKTGRAARTVRRDVAIGRAIPADVAETIASVPTVANSPKELARLAKLPEDQQRAVAGCLRAGEARTVTEALRDHDAPEPQPADQACTSLRRGLARVLDSWRRECGTAATPALGASVLEAAASELLERGWTVRKPR